MPKKRNEHVKSKEGDFTVATIHHPEKMTKYFLRGNQSKFVTSIKFEGFVGIPQGLYLNKQGYGFPGNTKGYYLLEQLVESAGNGKQIDLAITKNDSRSFREYKHKVTIKIGITSLKELVAKMRVESQKNTEEAKSQIASYLSFLFPEKIQTSSTAFNLYTGGEVREVLNKVGISEKLNESDLEAIFDFFPKVFNASIRGRTKILKDLKIRLAKEGKKITDRIFLDEVIDEFEKKIEMKSLKEEQWQIFLKEKVFPFLTNYVKVIDKENIGVDISYPDFVLVDVYGFADIFEIKTHSTSLLSYDDSHNNYYWHADLAKAISQVENYIDTLQENDSAYIKKVKRKYGIDLQVLRPKGYIIAGTKSELKNIKAAEDFKKLRSSHKNIDFILYDELLENLKSIQTKLDSHE